MSISKDWPFDVDRVIPDPTDTCRNCPYPVTEQEMDLMEDALQVAEEE